MNSLLNNNLLHIFKPNQRHTYINPISSHLSTVATSQQNKDSPRGDGSAQPSFMLGKGLLSMAPQFTRNIFCGVVAGLQKKNDLRTHLMANAEM